MTKRQYIGSKGASRKLGVAERTIRDWASKFEWFGGQLENGDLVFTLEEVDRMQVTPRPALGRPRKPVIDVPPEMPVHTEDGPGGEGTLTPPPMPSLPVLVG